MSFLENAKTNLFSISSNYLLNMMDRPVLRGNIIAQLGQLKNAIFRKPFLFAHLALYHGYCDLLIVRLVCAAVVLNFQNHSNVSYEEEHFSPYFTYDLMLGFLLKVKMLDGYLALVGWPSMLLAIAIDVIARFSKGTVSYQLTYDLLILNKEGLILTRPPLDEPWFRKLLPLTFRLLLSRETLEEPTVQLNYPPLDHFPLVDRPIRARAALLSATFDLSIAAFSVLFSLVGVSLVVTYYLSFIWSKYSGWQGALLVLDGSATLYLVLYCTQLSFFLIHGIYLVLYVHVAHQRSLNRTLERCTVRVHKSTSSTPSSVIAALQKIKTNPENLKTLTSKNITATATIKFLLPHYLRSHLRFAVNVLATNVEIASPILFLTLTTLFGSNVYSVTKMALKDLAFTENGLLLIISGLSTFFLLLTVQPMVTTARILNTNPTRQVLYGAVGCLSGSSANIRLKLKTASYYELLITGEKIAYTVGPLGKITNEAIFQFSFFYLAYLIFCFNLIIQEK